jgi:hypothetical protein
VLLSIAFATDCIANAIISLVFAKGISEGKKTEKGSLFKIISFILLTVLFYDRGISFRVYKVLFDIYP